MLASPFDARLAAHFIYRLDNGTNPEGVVKLLHGNVIQ